MKIILASLMLLTAPIAWLLAASGVEIEPPTAEEVMSFFMALGGWKTLGILGMVGLGIQGVMLLFRSKLGEYTGKVRMWAVLGLTAVSAPITLVLAGVPWNEAILHSSTLAAFQVLINQLWKQHFVKED